MIPRIEEELCLLRRRFPDHDYQEPGNWVRLKVYPLPDGWNRTSTEVAFAILPPPQAPYGIYVPAGLLFKGNRPNNYTEPVSGIPFPGSWGVFSWRPEDGQWRPATTAAEGSNYLNWALGFSARFREGV